MSQFVGPTYLVPLSLSSSFTLHILPVTMSYVAGDGGGHTRNIREGPHCDIVFLQFVGPTYRMKSVVNNCVQILGLGKRGKVEFSRG